MKGDSLPGLSHIVRHVRGSRINIDKSSVNPEEFKGTDEISINWLECDHDEIGSQSTLEDQLKRVRKLVATYREIRKSSKLAELDIAKVRRSKFVEDVVEDPIPRSEDHPRIPCHSIIKIAPNSDEDIVAEALAACVTTLHEAKDSKDSS